MGGCFKGCLVLVVILFFWPVILAAAVLYLVYLAARALYRLWRSDHPVRTKRLVTGTLIYPVGVYFLVRYTPYGNPVKWAFAGLGTVTTLLLLTSGEAGLTLALVTAAAFALLFARGTRAGGAISVPPRERPAVRVTGPGSVNVPAVELRRLLEIEEAPSTAERTLLLAREFDRLATEVCGVVLLDHRGRPSDGRLRVLAAETELLAASARDQLAFPATAAADVPFAELPDAIGSLRAYADLLAAVGATTSAPPEQLRVLARERGRLQRYQERLMQELTERLP